MRKFVKSIVTLLSICFIISLCAVFGGVDAERSADAKSYETTVKDVRNLQHISTVIEGYIYFDYTVEDTGAYEVTETQRKLIELNGMSLYDIGRNYPTLFYWLQWRRDANTGERLMSLAIDETSPFSYLMGNSDGTPRKNTLTVKAGFVTVDGKRVTEDKTVEFNSIDHPVSLTGVGLLDQDSISHCYIGFEFDMPYRFEWTDVNHLDSYASWIYVNGVPLSSLTDKSGITLYWDHDFVPEYCIPGTDKLTLMLDFSNNPIIKEGENTILLRKGMQIHWSGIGATDPTSIPTASFWKLDKDYSVTFNSVAGDENNKISINKELNYTTFDATLFEKEVEIGDEFTLPATIDFKVDKDSEETVTSKVTWSSQVASTPGIMEVYATINDFRYAYGNDVRKTLKVSFKVNSFVRQLSYPTECSSITYGDILGKSIIEGNICMYGVFDFADPNLILDVGEHEVEIVFCPTNDECEFDLGNEKHTVKVIVKPATPTFPEINSFKGKMYKAGTQLKDLKLPDGCTWKNPEETLKEGTNGYTVIYTPDNANYFAVTKKIEITAEVPLGEGQTSNARA